MVVGGYFFDDSDRERFLSQLQDCLENYGVVLHAYVLMSNHYHLLVRTAHANLSRFMQRLNTSYALYSRYKHRKPGHQLEGRYKAKLVQGDEYMMTLTRYIHLNPVKVKALQNQGKGDLVQGCLMEDDSELRGLLERSSYGIGDEEYVEALEEELRGRQSGGARDRDVAYPDEGISLDRIDEIVAGKYVIGVKELKAHGRRKKTGTAKLVPPETLARLAALIRKQAHVSN